MESGWDMGTPSSPQQQGMGIQALDTSSAITAHVFTLPTPSARAVTDEPHQTPNSVSAAATHGQALPHPCGKAVCIPALLLRPDLCAPHSTSHHAKFYSWDTQEGPARIQLVNSHIPTTLSRSTCQSPDRKVSAVSNNGLQCSLCTGQCDLEYPTWPWPWLGTPSTPDMHSHPHHLLWAQGTLRGYTHVHVHLFSSISSISGTGKGCDLLTVWEKSLFILSGRVLCAVRASQLTCVLTGDIIWGADRGALVHLPNHGGLPADHSQQKEKLLQIYPALFQHPNTVQKSQCWVSVGWRCGHRLPSADSTEPQGPSGLAVTGALLSALCGNKLIDIC